MLSYLTTGTNYLASFWANPLARTPLYSASRCASALTEPRLIFGSPRAASARVSAHSGNDRFRERRNSKPLLGGAAPRAHKGSDRWATRYTECERF